MDRLGRHTKDAIAFLAIATGAFLRFDGLGVPSYWLDEILGQKLTTSAASAPWWRWLAGFAEEHGPLYYATQLAGRTFGTSEFAGRLLPAIFGVAAIVLAYFASRSVAVAILMAVSPLAVYYSREARPYALLMMLTAALIVLLLRECGTGSQPVRGREAAAFGGGRVENPSHMTCALIPAIAYTSAVGVPVIAAVLVIALVLRRPRIVGFAAAALIVVAILYRTSTQPTAGFPAVNLGTVMTLLRTFSVSALGTPIGGRAAVATFALAAIGAVVLARRDRRAAIVIIGMTVLPAAIAVTALYAFNHWYGPRYVAASLIGYVMLAGFGIDALTKRWAPLLAIALAWQAWPAVRVESFRKLDWRAIAAKIHQYAHPGDLVIAAEPWSEVALRYYLGRLPPRVQLEGVPYWNVAEGLIRRPGTWLVSAGFGNSTTRSWMCRYPLVLASPLEGFRMHYASDFVRERGSPAELRAVSAALGPNLFIDLAAAQNPYLDSGWAGPEGFRWAVGTRAAVTFPRWGQRDRVIRMWVNPMDHAKLSPQTLRASVNGQSIGEITLVRGWEERAFTAPASVWRDGMNTVTFDFGRAAAPADLDPRATDHRALAVAFEWISVDDGPPGVVKQHQYAIRIASAPFIDETSAWRNTRTRFGPAPAALAGRLGFDPEAASRVHLEDLVESVSYGSDCEDDHTFLHRAFALIVDRAPDRYEEGALAKLPRDRVPVRLTKSEEFRRVVLAAAPDRSPAPDMHTPRTRTP